MSTRAAMPLSADHVVGLFSRDELSSALAATHRAGFGPQARVIDGTRGSIADQLARLGLRVEWDEPPSADAVLIVVSAPGRPAKVADLFERSSARSIWFAERRIVERPKPERAPALAPDIRIGQAPEAASEA